MNISNILDSVLGDNAIQATIAFVLLVFVFGMFLAPYSDLPARVSQLERSNDELRREMREQSQRLELVVCFLETEAAGGNPLGCSR